MTFFGRLGGRSGWKDVLHIGLGKYTQARKETAGRERHHVGLNKLLEKLPGEKNQGEARGEQARRNGSVRDKNEGRLGGSVTLRLR